MEGMCVLAGGTKINKTLIDGEECVWVVDGIACGARR